MADGNDTPRPPARSEDKSNDDDLSIDANVDNSGKAAVQSKLIFFRSVEFGRRCICVITENAQEMPKQNVNVTCNQITFDH